MGQVSEFFIFTFIIHRIILKWNSWQRILWIDRNANSMCISKIKKKTTFSTFSFTHFFLNNRNTYRQVSNYNTILFLDLYFCSFLETIDVNKEKEDLYDYSTLKCFNNIRFRPAWTQQCILYFSWYFFF